MAKFIRHIGRHGDRKVAVIFREVPGESHMCLVTYTELLNQNIHDPMIQCIESDIGQNSENLADALNRSFTRDGKPILQVLHMEGQLKKINTDNVVMTPQPNVKIKLSELNKILDEMKQGEEAVRKLAELDKSSGMQDPADVARRMRTDKLPSVLQENRQTTTSTNDILVDSQLAENFRAQAKKMELEARGLLAESARLLKEAEIMEPKNIVIEAPPTVKKRGRVAKAKTVA